MLSIFDPIKGETATVYKKSYTPQDVESANNEQAFAQIRHYAFLLHLYVTKLLSHRTKKRIFVKYILISFVKKKKLTLLSNIK